MSADKCCARRSSPIEHRSSFQRSAVSSRQRALPSRPAAAHHCEAWWRFPPYLPVRDPIAPVAAPSTEPVTDLTPSFSPATACRSIRRASSVGSDQPVSQLNVPVALRWVKWPTARKQWLGLLLIIAGRKALALCGIITQFVAGTNFLLLSRMSGEP